MQIVSPKDWIALATLGGLVIIGLIWSIFGRIPITVAGKGVLIRPYRVMSFESPISGQLKSVNIKPGECVEKGQVLATIEPIELKQQLLLQRSKLSELQIQAQGVRIIQQQRITTEKSAISSSKASLNKRFQDTQSLTPAFYEKGLNAIKQQRISIQQRLNDAITLIPIYKDRLQKRQQLLGSGAISKDTVLQAEQEYRQGLQNVSDLQAQLKQLDVNETEAQQRYLQNLSSLGDIQTQLQELDTRNKRLDQENIESINTRLNQIQEVKRAIAQLEKQVSTNSQILSVNSGCVLEVTAFAGQIANPGTRIATMNRGGKNTSLMAVSYFAIKDGKQIKPGMTVQVTPDSVKRERFGGIVGKVISVSPLSVTREGASSLIGNSDLVAKLLPTGAEIEVRAEMGLDSSTLSGYKWSSSQ